ncbi:YlbF family regulator [Lactococcus termiticola]|uniref:Uncharacterized protein n=1 Tax=Lactococcus termiticola TaxID=2169526 RepID=A0A2R5HEX1_9LACT|nr:YlbF family regulator [Lactococcus termiticola]GBG96599.1 hypothetical protein NtB2_00712 [Lactococcus termiticola]
MQTATQEKLEELKAMLLELDYVSDFKQAESRLKVEPGVFEAQQQMKELQKEAVLFQKIGKPEAYRQSMREAGRLEKILKNHLLVQDYAQKMAPVNSLLEHLTGEIERQVNQKVKEGS